MNILIAEDNLASRELLREMLEMWGHSVCESENGAEALARLESCDVDLVLLDIQMPVMDGLEAIGRIRDSRFASLTVIALTAFAMSGDRQRLLQVGFNEYLSKPVNFPQLKKMVEEAERVRMGPSLGDVLGLKPADGTARPRS